MSETQKLKVGIIGTGWVARMRHVPAIKRNPDCEIVAVLNPVADLAQKFAAANDIPNSFSDLNEFLKEPLDIVVICTPPMSHYETAKAALEAGKHVLMEKPLTLKSEQSAELGELARSKNLLLTPSHNFLFCRSMDKAKKLLAENKIGQITGAIGLQWSSHTRQLPTWINQLRGGLFFDESPHLLYLLDYFIKDLKVESAWHSQFPANNLERYEARLQGQNGEALLSMWFGAPLSEWLIVVCGTEGAFVLDIFRDALIYFPKEGNRTPTYLLKVLFNADKQIWSQMFKWIASRFTRGSHMFGLDNLVNQFVTSVKTKSTPPLTAADGGRIVKLIEDILNKSGQ